MGLKLERIRGKAQQYALYIRQNSDNTQFCPLKRAAYNNTNTVVGQWHVLLAVAHRF